MRSRFSKELNRKQLDHWLIFNCTLPLWSIRNGQQNELNVEKVSIELSTDWIVRTLKGIVFNVWNYLGNVVGYFAARGIKAVGAGAAGAAIAAQAYVNVHKGVFQMCKLVKLLLMQEMRGLLALCDVSRHNYTWRCDALARPQELHRIASISLMSPMSLLAVMTTRRMSLVQSWSPQKGYEYVLFVWFSHFIFHAVQIFNYLLCKMLPIFIG